MKVLFNLNLSLTALLSFSLNGIASAQTVSTSNPPCQAVDVMGKVYYTAVMTGDGPICVKYDLSLGSSIEADFGNIGCYDSFVADKTFGTLSSISGDVATYTPDAGGWSGQVSFEEQTPEQNEDPAEVKMILSTYQESIKMFSVRLLFPSCTSLLTSPTQPPTPVPTCSIEEFMGKTYYAPLPPATGICVKVDLFNGGTASIDPANTNCASPYTETAENVYSTFLGISGNKALFSGTFTGEVLIEQSMTGSVDLEARIIDFDTSSMSWKLLEILLSCTNMTLNQYLLVAQS